jgi:hypothetical protein
MSRCSANERARHVWHQGTAVSIVKPDFPDVVGQIGYARSDLPKLDSPNHGPWFWTGAPCSPKRTPDFLWTLLALANFMRLSLMKAAYAGVGGAPCRKSGYMGRKRIFSNAFTSRTKALPLGRSPFVRPTGATKGAAPHLFQPMYAEANMGHPSREQGLILCSYRCPNDEL